MNCHFILICYESTVEDRNSFQPTEAAATENPLTSLQSLLEESLTSKSNHSACSKSWLIVPVPRRRDCCGSVMGWPSRAGSEPASPRARCQCSAAWGSVSAGSPGRHPGEQAAAVWSSRTRPFPGSRPYATARWSGNDEDNDSIKKRFLYRLMCPILREDT